MLESMNKKTLIIIGSSIIGLIVCLLIVVWLVSILKPHYYSYEDFEVKITEATKKYYKDNPTQLPASDGEYNMSYSTLVDGEYIKPINEMLKDGDNCTVQILVTKYSDNYSYIPYLTCPGSYETKELYKVILEQNPVVESGTGLYSDGNSGYYFRGDVTNNYVQIGEYGEEKREKPYLWQIMGVESDNTIKIISAHTTSERYTWDDRYNEKEESFDGYNDFEKSRLKDTLITLAGNDEILSEEFRNKFVAKELCIGKRKQTDTTKDGSVECETKTETKYLFGLITPYEFMRTSLDSNCKVAGSLSCLNYNYLSGYTTNSWSITSDAENTNKTYSFGGGVMAPYKSDREKKLYVVTYINKRVFFKSGTGTADDPYIIR